VFVREHLFGREVDLESLNTIRNLSEPDVTKTLIDTFKKAINALTVKERGDAQISDTIKLRMTRPFVTKGQEYVVPKKSIFRRIVGDSHFELEFANFLDQCEDIISFTKNFLAVGFKLDYVRADGSISNYIPDFLVKRGGRRMAVVETKGAEELDLPLKMARLKQWCADVNAAQSDVRWDFVYVDQESFEKDRPKDFGQLMSGFRKFQ
jgi:type III restriction enzyme